MEKNVIKIKFSIFITIIIVSVLVVSAIMALVLGKDNKENNQGSNMEQVNEEANNKEKFVKIRYAYAYTVTTADILNKNSEDGEYIDILEIKLEGKILEKINNLLEKQSYRKVKGVASIVLDEYEVNINDEVKLAISPAMDYAYYTKGEESFLIKISEELVAEIDRIVQEEASKKIKQFSSKKITIISEDSKQVTIADDEYIKQLSDNSKHTKVNINKETLNDEKISYVVDFNNGTKIYVYFASSLGCIVNENGQKYYATFISDYNNIVETIFNNYISGINESINAEKIIVKYLGNEYNITDTKEVEYVINTLKMCNYYSYYGLYNFDEEDYGSEDIVIEFGNSKVIIHLNSVSYYIDGEKNVYSILGLNELEDYFKELVDYKE